MWRHRRGPSANFGRHNDPLVGQQVGGANVFGGGLALYAEEQRPSDLLVDG